MGNPGGRDDEENWWQPLLDDPPSEDVLFDNNDHLDHDPDDLTACSFSSWIKEATNQAEAGSVRQLAPEDFIRSNCKDQGSQNSRLGDKQLVMLEVPELTPAPIHEGSQAASRTDPLENQMVAGVQQQLSQPAAATSTVDSRSRKNTGELSEAQQKRLARKRECDKKYRERKKEKTQKLEVEIQEKQQQIRSVEAFDAEIQRLKDEIASLRNNLEHKEQLTMDGMGSHDDSNDTNESDDKDSIWNDANEQIFIDLMVEEVKKGNRTTGTFSKPGWRNIAQGLKEKIGRDYTNAQLKGKYQSLRTRHRKLTALIQEIGSGTGQVNAIEEVWVTLKRVHSLATRFRNKSCKEYRELCLIFDETTASGNHQHGSTKLPTDGEGESHGTNLPGLSLRASADDVTELAYDNEMEPRARKNESPVCTPKKKKGKRTFSQAIESALLTISEQSKRKNDLLEQRMSASSVGDNRDEAHSCGNRDVNAMKECLRSLDALGLEALLMVKQ